MPEWLAAISQISLSAALAVFGLVLLLSPHNRVTMLTNVMVPAVWLMSALSMLHYFVPLHGWPLLGMSLLWWLLSFVAYRHLSVLARQSRRTESNRLYGRRTDD